jgi:hypothetical protein
VARRAVAFQPRDGVQRSRFTLVGGGGAMLVAIIAILTIASFRSNADVAPSLRIAVRVGFVILFGSMVTGALMIAKG